MPCEREKNKQKKPPTDECVLWDGVLIYLFIYSHFAAIDVFKKNFFFFFPHLHSPDAWRTASVVAAVEADISGVCGWSFSSETKSAVAQRFFRRITQRNDFCFLLNGSCKSSLSQFFDLLRCCSVSEQFRNDYWSSWKMHDAPRFMSHERFPDSFSDCADTFCCMSDQDLFWHLWKLIVFLKLHLQCWSV